MKIYFRDRNEVLVNQFEKFSSIAKTVLPEITFDIAVGDPLEVPAAAIVSPANSFGFMDGGIDQHYTNFFGPQLQIDLQDFIENSQYGEILVGDAVSIPTNNDHIGWLICAPTMRVPVLISDYMDVFLSTRAAFRQAIGYAFSSVIIPGMGTGIGGVPYENASKAMNFGIVSAFKPKSFPKTLREASQGHYNLEW